VKIGLFSPFEPAPGKQQGADGRDRDADDCVNLHGFSLLSAWRNEKFA
jgi:hypothetical protein